ncbi:MAG: ArnT family glycosyltransferase [Acidimicrobiales bacterium]
MTDTELLGLPREPLTRGFRRASTWRRSWSGVRRLGLVTVLAWTAIVLALTVGVVLRAWYVFHQPINADEAVVGLMAMQIVHGHFSAFYWGQVYGGAEPFLVAMLFGIFGTSTWALEAVAIALSVGAAVVSWRIARRLVADPLLAVLAGALVWAAPQAAVWNSTIELGFRGVTLLCGLGILLVALRVLDGALGWAEFVALGLLAGVGWWSSPEIVYFVLPTVALVIWAIVQDPEIRRLGRWSARLGVVITAGVVGALPWLWANFNSGFRSLDTSAFVAPPNPPGYGSRLELFFRDGLPMLFSLRTAETLQPVWGSVGMRLLLVAVLAVLGAALVLCCVKGGRSLVLAASVVIFPFIMALSPATWFEKDGRYSDFVAPLIVFVLVIGSGEAAQWVGVLRRRWARHEIDVARALMSTVVISLVVLSIVNFTSYEPYVYPTASFGSGWTNPDAPTLQAISELETAGIQYGYADYWVAYRLDFLSDGRLAITTAGGDVDRWHALIRQVQGSRRQAWLFVNPDAEAIEQFAKTSYIQGPDGLSQSAFLAGLQRLGIGYRIIDTGLIQAVVPNRPVQPSTVGLPGGP